MSRSINQAWDKKLSFDWFMAVFEVIEHEVIAYHQGALTSRQTSSWPVRSLLSSGDEVVCGAHKCGLVGERINWGLDHQSPFLAHVSHPKESVTTTTLLSPLTSEWRRRREIGRAFKVGIFILSDYFILTSETAIFRNSTPFICKRSDNLEITLRRAIKAATSIDLRILRS